MQGQRLAAFGPTLAESAQIWLKWGPTEVVQTWSSSANGSRSKQYLGPIWADFGQYRPTCDQIPAAMWAISAEFDRNRPTSVEIVQTWLTSANASRTPPQLGQTWANFVQQCSTSRLKSPKCGRSLGKFGRIHTDFGRNREHMVDVRRLADIGPNSANTAYVFSWQIRPTSRTRVSWPLSEQIWPTRAST